MTGLTVVDDCDGWIIVEDKDTPLQPQKQADLSRNPNNLS
jgi:hypothetical protein